jgi:hypothetical protein
MLEKVRLLVHALTQDLRLEVKTGERTVLEAVDRSMQDTTHCTHVTRLVLDSDRYAHKLVFVIIAARRIRACAESCPPKTQICTSWKSSVAAIIGARDVRVCRLCLRWGFTTLTYFGPTPPLLNTASSQGGCTLLQVCLRVIHALYLCMHCESIRVCSKLRWTCLRNIRSEPTYHCILFRLWIQSSSL